MSETYDRDFYAWANEQAALLRAGTFPATCPWSFEQIVDHEFWPI
jgi:hypothetical protein